MAENAAHVYGFRVVCFLFVFLVLCSMCYCFVGSSCWLLVCFWFCLYFYVCCWCLFSDFLHCTLGRHHFCHLTLHQHDFWVTSSHTRTLYMCVTNQSYRLMTNAYMLSENIDGGCTHIYIYTHIYIIYIHINHERLPIHTCTRTHWWSLHMCLKTYWCLRLGWCWEETVRMLWGSWNEAGKARML